MKKALIVLPVLALAACDKPTSEVQLDCGHAYQDSETMVHAKTYDDKAVLKINGGEEITLKRKIDPDGKPSLSYEHYDYEGDAPEYNGKVDFYFGLDKSNGTIEHYGISFDGNDGSWSCNVRNKFYGKYKKPSKEEICIRDICNRIFFEPDEDVKPGQPKKLVISKNINEYNGNRQSVRFRSENFVLPQEDALAISKNWDYNNMKTYDNDDNELKEHEKDACEVLDRLNAYIKAKGFDKTQYIYKMNTKSMGKFANYSWLKNKEIQSPDKLENGYLDIRSIDCSNKDLSMYDVDKISFDHNTVFPKDANKLPKGFDAKKIADMHRTPGLNVHKLHEMGIDGRGVSMAIIDQKLAPHQEYSENLAWYEEFLNDENQQDEGQMHGSAVASIAVGKTVGIAPKAKLYYFAADLTDEMAPQIKKDGDEASVRTSSYYSRALDEIIDMNRNLPDDEKIVVVSISAAPGWSRNPKWWENTLERAKKAGIFVTTTEIDKEYGLKDNGVNRDVFGDPEDPNSYSQTAWQKGQNPSIDVQKKTLCFPMDHRTTAAPNGNDQYVHYANGGWSWMKPYEAGLYVLAKQVKKDVTPEEFFKVGLETGTYSERAKCVLVNPVALIEALKK